MITKHLLVQLLFSSWGLEESSAEDVDGAGLEEKQVLLVILADGLVDPFVGRQQVLVVDFSRQQRIRWVRVNTVAKRLIDELITEQIGFFGHIGSHYFPEFGEVVHESSLIGEQVLLQFHHIIGQVKLPKLYFQAVLSQRKALVIISKLHLQRRRERAPLGGPSW